MGTDLIKPKKQRAQKIKDETDSFGTKFITLNVEIEPDSYMFMSYDASEGSHQELYDHISNNFEIVEVFR